MHCQYHNWDRWQYIPIVKSLHVHCTHHSLWQPQTLDPLWQPQTLCDNHRPSVTTTDPLWQPQIFCDNHRPTVTTTDPLWQPQTHCDNQTFCDNHRPSVTTTDLRHPSFTINTWCPPNIVTNCHTESDGVHQTGVHEPYSQSTLHDANHTAPNIIMRNSTNNSQQQNHDHRRHLCTCMYSSLQKPLPTRAR